MNRLLKHVLRLLGFALFVFFVTKIYTGHWGIRDYIAARKDRIKLEKQYSMAEYDRNRNLAELTDLRKNPLYLDEQVKIDLKKGRKGEVYYLFQDKEDTGRNGAANTK